MSHQMGVSASTGDRVAGRVGNAALCGVTDVPSALNRRGVDTGVCAGWTLEGAAVDPRGDWTEQCGLWTGDGPVP